MSTNKLQKRNFSIGKFLAEWGPVAAIPLLFLIFTCIDPKTYLGWNNILTILRSAAIYLIVAMGSTFAFSCGVFDLSVGSTVTLGGMFAITFQSLYGMPWWLACLATIAACMIIGAVNAVLVLKFKIPGVLATLSMQFILSGLALTYSAGQVITATKANRPTQTVVREVPQIFWDLGKAPWIISIALVCVALVAIFQNKIKHGRYLYMVGENEEAARLSGIRVNRYRTLAFLMTTVFAAIGGTVMAARNGSVATTAGAAYLMPAIAAVNIGRSVAGVNKPNAIGSFVGVMLWTVLDNGLLMVGVPYYMVDMAKGAILLLTLIIVNMSSISGARRKFAKK